MCYMQLAAAGMILKNYTKVTSFPETSTLASTST